MKKILLFIPLLIVMVLFAGCTSIGEPQTTPPASVPEITQPVIPTVVPEIVVTDIPTEEPAISPELTVEPTPEVEITPEMTPVIELPLIPTESPGLTTVPVVTTLEASATPIPQ
jgi:hypothetical protein